MEYPKAIMRRKELVEMGFPYELLDRAYRAPGQKFAQKINPYKKHRRSSMIRRSLKSGDQKNRRKKTKH